MCMFWAVRGSLSIQREPTQKCKLHAEWPQPYHHAALCQVQMLENMYLKGVVADQQYLTHGGGKDNSTNVAIVCKSQF